jgi:hypothetical protein
VDFNDFSRDDFIPEGDGQVTSGSASLLDLGTDTRKRADGEEWKRRRVLLASLQSSTSPEMYCWTEKN